MALIFQRLTRFGDDCELAIVATQWSHPRFLEWPVEISDEKAVGSDSHAAQTCSSFFWVPVGVDSRYTGNLHPLMLQNSLTGYIGSCLLEVEGQEMVGRNYGNQSG